MSQATPRADATLPHRFGLPLPALAFGQLRFWLVVAATLHAIANPVSAQPWYEHYEQADRALEEQDWAAAVEQINQALEQRGDSGVRVRTYGMRFTEYFPYLKLGIAYYHLGQFEAALQAFETEQRLEAIGRSASSLKRFS